jgi:hypothetical protein
MALQALNIIKEEFANARNDAGMLDIPLRLLQRRIVERIENECLDQPEPEESNIDRAVNYLRGVHVMDDVDVMDDGEFSVEVEECDEDQMRDHMRRGGDPADLVKPPRCTWCKAVDAEAVDTFWVREVGEMRESKEALCDSCMEQMVEDGIQIEAVKKGPEKYCRWCGFNRENCSGGGGPDGIEAHDFLERVIDDVVAGMSEEDIPF